MQQTKLDRVLCPSIRSMGDVLAIRQVSSAVHEFVYTYISQDTEIQKNTIGIILLHEIEMRLNHGSSGF